MKYINLDNVQEAGGTLPPGGYICKIIKVIDDPQKEYLKIEYDITHGQYTGYYLQLYQNRNFWGGILIKSYKETALPFFKAFITAVENSNPSFKFDGQNENTLVGKYIGLVLGLEEYQSNTGEIKKRLYVAETRSGQSIKEGKFKVPELKKLNQASNNSKPPAQTGFQYDDGFIPVSDGVDDDDLPF